MNLAKALEQQGVKQRELGRRLGYGSNGAISGVLKGRIGVPADDIPKWADALELKGADRDDFIDFYAEIAIPKWYRDRLAASESEAVDLRAQASEMRAEIAELSAKVAKLRAQRQKTDTK